MNKNYSNPKIDKINEHVAKLFKTSNVSSVDQYFEPISIISGHFCRFSVVNELFDFSKTMIIIKEVQPDFQFNKLQIMCLQGNKETIVQIIKDNKLCYKLQKRIYYTIHQDTKCKRLKFIKKSNTSTLMYSFRVRSQKGKKNYQKF